MGLKKGCSKEDVLKTAAKLQKKIHPDMNRDVNSERLSQLVNEAKEKIIKLKNLGEKTWLVIVDPE